jgi:hypothetical protein
LALGSILPTERPIHNTPVDIDPGKSWETKADWEFSATDLKDGDYVDRGSEVAGARTRHPWCDRRPVSGDGESRPILVDAGAIVAYGKTDVDDASSALHDRTQIGVTSIEGYHSVDPGKLTTAPLFAKRAADRVCEFEAQR